MKNFNALKRTNSKGKSNVQQNLNPQNPKSDLIEQIKKEFNKGNGEILKGISLIVGAIDQGNKNLVTNIVTTIKSSNQDLVANMVTTIESSNQNLVTNMTNTIIIQKKLLAFAPKVNRIQTNSLIILINLN